MAKVKTVCYGELREWKSKKAAMDFFFDGMVSCEGCESERYENIYCKLKEGFTVADDTDNWEPAEQELTVRRVCNERN